MWTQAQNGVCPATNPSGPWPGGWCDSVITVNGKQHPEDRYNCVKAGGVAGQDSTGKPKCFMPTGGVKLSNTGQMAPDSSSGGGVPMWAMALGGVAVVGAAYYFLLYKK